LAERPQRVERFGGVAVRVGAMSQHALPARVRDVEPVSVQIELAHQRVAHVDDAHTIHDVRTRPEFSESLTGGGQFIDQRSHARVIRITARSFT
jgi:hypothetical protein